MKAISLFSGVGGFELGFARAGIETVLQAERDPWALGVLAYHWPETRRVTDVRVVSNAAFQPPEQLEPDHRSIDVGIRAVARGDADGGRQPDIRVRGGSRADLIYGGFPCTDLSVAGKRAGLAGERSGLWFEFERVLSELRPTWTVIENVAGLLSSNGGRDLAVILRGLEQLGYGWAFRVLDAQHFGVPQRRRRVFIVGHLGGSAGPGAVLALCEGCGGDTAARGATGEGIAYTLAASVRGTGDGHGNAWNSNYVAGDYSQGGYRESAVAATLKGSSDHSRRGALIASALSASMGHHGHSSPRGDGSDNLIPAVAPALTASGRGTARTGDSRGQDPLVLDTYIPAGVRRLTPIECERLMGWPDDHTRWAVMEGVMVEVADSHRYRMCGNGVVPPVAEWIGRRIVAVADE